MADPDDPRTAARNRLMGRLLLIAFGLLLAAYVIPTILRR